MILYQYSDFLDAEIARLQKQEAEADALQVQLEYEANLAALGMRNLLPGPPFKGAIEGLLGGLLYGGNVLSYEVLTVTDSAEVSLNPPDKAKKAIFVVEADATSPNLKKVMRYQAGETAAPTSTVGIPISDEAVFEIGLLWNLKRFKIIGIPAGKTHKITVEYQG